VGSDIYLSITELAQLVAEQFQPKHKFEISSNPDPNKPLERYVPAIVRTRNELNLKQSIDLTNAIKRTIMFYRGKI